MRQQEKPLTLTDGFLAIATWLAGVFFFVAWGILRWMLTSSPMIVGVLFLPAIFIYGIASLSFGAVLAVPLTPRVVCPRCGALGDDFSNPSGLEVLKALVTFFLVEATAVSLLWPYLVQAASKGRLRV